MRLGAGSVLIVTLACGCSNSSKGPEDMAVVTSDADMASSSSDDLASTGSDGGTGDMAHARVLSFGAASALQMTDQFFTKAFVADFNHDGKVDLLLLGHAPIIAGQPVSYVFDPELGNGDGTFSFVSTHAISNNQPTADVGDYNQDQKSDIALYSGQCTTNPITHVTTCTAGLTIDTSNGDGTFASAAGPTLASTTYFYGLAASDLNGDNVVDFVTATRDSGNNPTGFAVYLNNGSAMAPTIGTYATPTFPGAVSPVVLADMTGDSKLDVVYGSANAIVVSANNGSGSFANPTTISTSYSDDIVLARDFNGDQRPDLLVGHDQTFSMYTALATGGFATPNDYSVGAAVTSLGVGDFDGDGLLDVVVCDGSNLRFFLNEGNGFKPPLTIAQTCNALAIGDFNNDHLDDVAVNGSVLLNQTH